MEFTAVSYTHLSKASLPKTLFRQKAKQQILQFQQPTGHMVLRSNQNQRSYPGTVSDCIVHRQNRTQ